MSAFAEREAVAGRTAFGVVSVVELAAVPLDEAVDGVPAAAPPAVDPVESLRPPAGAPIAGVGEVLTGPLPFLAAAAMAAAAFTSPWHPCSNPQVTEVFSVDIRVCTACSWLSPRPSRRARVPETNGVAMEVPSSVA